MFGGLYLPLLRKVRHSFPGTPPSSLKTSVVAPRWTAPAAAVFAEPVAAPVVAPVAAPAAPPAATPAAAPAAAPAPFRPFLRACRLAAEAVAAKTVRMNANLILNGKKAEGGLKFPEAKVKIW